MHDDNPYAADSISNAVGISVEVPEADLKGIQIVAGALIAGLFLFLGIVCIATRLQMKWDAGLVTGIGGVWILAATALSFVIPSVVTAGKLKELGQKRQGGNAAHDNSDLPQALMGIYRAQMIVGRALIEGAGFMCAIAGLIEKSWIGLLLAVAAVLQMLVRFPTRSRVQFWLEDKTRHIGTGY